jgi:hypothetical protein
MNTQNSNNEASTGSARPSSVQEIEITGDSSEYMQRHGWKLAGTTNEQTVLVLIRWNYQEAGYAVAFTWGNGNGNVLYWIHHGD